MTNKERAAMQAAWVWMDWYASNNGTLEPVDLNETITALREALAEPQITTPDVCGEVCARAKLCYGCNKDLEEANAKYVEQAEQEPVAWMQKGTIEWIKQPRNERNQTQVIVTGVNVFDGQIPLYAAPVRTKDLTDDYYELIYAVGSKFPNESRHETALRYIRQAEQEPVGRWNWNEAKFEWLTKFDYYKHHMTPLYAAPVRTKDLTDEDIWEALHDKGLMEGIRAVIAADREKNRG